VDLRDYRERSPREVSPGPSPASSGPSAPKPHPEVLSQDLPPAEPISRGVGEKAVPAGSGTFEETLARELHQNLNSDIVRHAQVILRDKGEGLIRLSLKPESLGNVKIRLELTENTIAGRIIVESGEALRAFEREIASLEQAFRDSGYESAELGAFLAQDGQGSGGGEERPFYSPRFAADRAASRYDETLERTDTSLSEDSEKGLLPGNRRISVNMLI
jgi:flagellar hook-length control protein FliK